MGEICINDELITYTVGKKVEQTGWYICVPCGYKKFLRKGSVFPKCMQCIGKERKDLKRGMELWEKATEEKVDLN